MHEAGAEDRHVLSKLCQHDLGDPECLDGRFVGAGNQVFMFGMERPSLSRRKWRRAAVIKQDLLVGYH